MVSSSYGFWVVPFGDMTGVIAISFLVFPRNGVTIELAFFFAFSSTFVSLLSDFKLYGSWISSSLIFSAFAVLLSNQSWGSYTTGAWCCSDFFDMTDDDSLEEDRASEDISKESSLSSSCFLSDFFKALPVLVSADFFDYSCFRAPEDLSGTVSDFLFMLLKNSVD